MMGDLAKKLGIKAGDRICLLDAPVEAVAAIRSDSPGEVSFLEAPGEGKIDLIVFWPKKLSGLAGRFAELQSRIDPDGAIWAVIPKKKYAKMRGVDFTWEELQAAGLQTDLVDNKIASITEQDYGTRFVIRKDRRDKYRKTQVFS